MTDKQKALSRLRRSLARACSKAEGLGHCVVVFGEGPTDSTVAIVGEAPGREETRQARPFVGRSGSFFISILEDVFHAPREDFYITNVVKVWPTVDTARLRTRPPTKEEFLIFLPYLHKELSVVSPKVVVAVGKTAFSALAPGEDFTPGRWVQAGGLEIMPVYHPSYLLRRQKDLEEIVRLLKSALRKVRARAAGR